MKKDSILVFDFDGTIADTFDYSHSVINQLAKEYKFRKVSPEEFLALKQKSKTEIIQTLKIPLLKVPRVLMKVNEAMNNALDKVAPHNDIPQILAELNAQQYHLVSLSNMSNSKVRQFLNKHKMPYFDAIETASEHADKSYKFRQMVKQCRWPGQQVYYIADEIRDIATAEKAGTHALIVGWGYGENNELKENAAKQYLATPEDLLQFCLSLQ